MTNDLNELMRQYRSAARKLAIMEEYGSSAEDFNQQRALCQSIRHELERRCPDTSLAASEYNITQTI